VADPEFLKMGEIQCIRPLSLSLMHIMNNTLFIRKNRLNGKKSEANRGGAPSPPPLNPPLMDRPNSLDKLFACLTAEIQGLK